MLRNAWGDHPCLAEMAKHIVQTQLGCQSTEYQNTYFKHNLFTESARVVPILSKGCCFRCLWLSAGFWAPGTPNIAPLGVFGQFACVSRPCSRYGQMCICFGAHERIMLDVVVSLRVFVEFVGPGGGHIHGPWRCISEVGVSPSWAPLTGSRVSSSCRA